MNEDHTVQFVGSGSRPATSGKRSPICRITSIPRELHSRLSVTLADPVIQFTLHIAELEPAGFMVA